MGPDEQGRDEAGGDDRAWAAPEAVAPTAPIEATGPIVTGAPDPQPAVADPAAEAVPDLPVPLRPMTMGDLLDGGFDVLRAAPRTVLALAAVFIVPVQLVVAFLNRDALADLDQLIEESLAGSGTTTTTAGQTWGSLLSTVGGSVGQTLIAAGIAVMVTHWYAGSSPGLKAVLLRLWRRSPALLGGWFFVHVLEVAGFFTLGIGTVVAMALFLVTAPAIVVEEIGPFAGMGRSARLAGGRFWPALGFALLSGLVASVLGQVLGIGPQLLGLVLGPDLGWIALGVGAIITQMVSTTVVGAATVLFYLDLRIRREGLDLAYAADRHLPR